MIDKLEEIKHRFEEVGQLIVQPDIMSDMKRYKQLSKEYKDLEKIVLKFDEYQTTVSNIENAKTVIASDLNTYEIMNADKLILSQSSVQVIEDILS